MAIEHRTYGIERLGALTDGVCAIAMTLLVLELKIPRGAIPTDADQEILTSLRDQTSEFAAWLISFLLIARIWQELHASMSGLERCDGPLIVLNIGALGACSLVPFGSALIGHFDESPISAIVFSFIMVSSGLLLAAINSHIHTHAWLLLKEANAWRYKYKTRYFLIAFSLVGAISVTLAFHHPLVGIAAWAVEPLAAGILALRRRRAA